MNETRLDPAIERRLREYHCKVEAFGVGGHAFCPTLGCADRKALLGEIDYLRGVLDVILPDYTSTLRDLAEVLKPPPVSMPRRESA